MTKLVICDIDATLVNEKKELTPRTKEALIKLHEKGIYFGIASGRPADELKRNKEYWDLPFDFDFVVGMNGAELWDGVHQKFYSYFMMKKEWFFFPLGIFFKAVGGIPVDRSRKTSLVDQMVHKFAEYKKFNLAITPEGTRKANPNWKKGFYFIALKAQVPIVLIGIDYSKKTISATKAIMPSGDINKDMREIKLYFKDFKGKHPENFALGEI